MNTSMSTLRGSTRLIFDGVEGITNTVEHMHQSIARQAQPWSRLLADGSRAHGVIASAVYSTIRGVNGGLRTGVDRTFELASPGAEPARTSPTETRLVAAVNGAIGDHLVATGNSLAIPMVLTTPGKQLRLDPQALAAAFPDASPNLHILVHGLGMSELGWRRKDAPCIGTVLQAATAATPLYLRYNTGQHISTNGRELARQLQDLCNAWPVPVESLSLIGHSMGGLVIRSACWYAQEAHSPWLEALQKIVCLGTPHHGAPLAKVGHALDQALEKIPYSQPLAFLRRRSEGVKDLRHGSLRDEDWLGDHCGQAGENRGPVVPLLPEVNYYFAAASVGRDGDDPLGQLLGDLLVRPDSAVGLHRNELRSLNVMPENCRVFHQKHHFDLLDDARVQQQIIDWFCAGKP